MCGPCSGASATLPQMATVTSTSQQAPISNSNPIAGTAAHAGHAALDGKQVPKQASTGGTQSSTGGKHAYHLQQAEAQGVQTTFASLAELEQYTGGKFSAEQLSKFNAGGETHFKKPGLNSGLVGYIVKKTPEGGAQILAGLYNGIGSHFHGRQLGHGDIYSPDQYGTMAIGQSY